MPKWLGSAVVCVVVLIYVFSGGMRSLSFANGIHATVLVALGGIILFLVVGKLGGLAEATRHVAERHPDLLREAGAGASQMGRMEFLTYLFVPLSVGMFPHLFQHWMTAKDVKTFRPVVILHPLFIMLVWTPCILLGVWATSATFGGAPLIDPRNAIEVKNVLATVVAKLTNPVVAGFLAVGIVSATMSLDSQFLALSSMFTHDIIAKAFGEKQFSDRQRIIAGRAMVVAIVVTAYVLSRNAPSTIYELGVWCFSGFSGLFPLVFAALYWRRVTTAGAIASIVATLAVMGLLVPRIALGSEQVPVPRHVARGRDLRRLRGDDRRRLARDPPARGGSRRAVLCRRVASGIAAITRSARGRGICSRRETAAWIRPAAGGSPRGRRRKASVVPR